MPINLPSNVKQDPATGLYVITNPAGKTIRVGVSGSDAQQQQQLDKYANSVRTGTPITITTTDSFTGNPSTNNFDPVQMIINKDANQAQADLNTASKRQAGVLINRDGSAQDIKTGVALTPEETQKRYTDAGLPANTAQLVNSKSPAEFIAAQNKLDQVVNKPSDLPVEASVQAAQAEQGTNVQTPDVPPAVTPAATDQAIVTPEDPLANLVITTRSTRVETTAATTPAIVTPTDPAANIDSTVAPAPPNLLIKGLVPPLQRNLENRVSEDTNGAPAPPRIIIDTEGLDPAFKQNMQDRLAEEAAERAAKEAKEKGANEAKPVKLFAPKKFIQKEDWRVRLSLAPSADYLYKAATAKDLLYPLLATDGVVFPYTPTINTSYKANYEPTDLVHSNYKNYFYKNSSVEDVSLTAEFTAQDTIEANYLLAVIHFFKSVTKMFYGQDESPRAGTPPPLVYLSGYGAFLYDNHPLVVTNFQLNLPIDVDYIRAGSSNTWDGQNIAAYQTKPKTPSTADKIRLAISGLPKAGIKPDPIFNSTMLGNKDSTYVPTKISITITMHPIVTRRDISTNFSLKDYATGKLSRGSQRNGGGIW